MSASHLCPLGGRFPRCVCVKQRNSFLNFSTVSQSRINQNGKFCLGKAASITAPWTTDKAKTGRGKRTNEIVLSYLQDPLTIFVADSMGRNPWNAPAKCSSALAFQVGITWRHSTFSKAIQKVMIKGCITFFSFKVTPSVHTHFRHPAAFEI